MDVPVRSFTVEVRSTKLTAKLLKQVRLLDYHGLHNHFGSVDAAMQHVVGWLVGSTFGASEWDHFLLLAKDGDLYLSHASMDCIKKFKQIYIS